MMRRSNLSFFDLCIIQWTSLSTREHVPFKQCTFQTRVCNNTSVDKIKELREVVDAAFKSQQRISEMPSKDTDVDAFMEWTDQIHYALQPILCEKCCDTYTMFEMEHPNQGGGVRGFKWKWWYDTNTQRDDDATPASNKRKEKKDNLPSKKMMM